jgi:D-serine deaminase-like pyridoxal phosphate-dependent protein
MVSWPSISGPSVAHALAAREPHGGLGRLATPAALVDADVLAENIRAMAGLAERAGVELWPHAKTHKSLAIARLQRDCGAAGVTVATLGEAERFVSAGFEDVLVAFPPIGAWRLDRLVDLARRARIRVALDDAETLRALDDACRLVGAEIGWLWEVDCGARRLGTPPGAPTADAIERLPRLRALRFEGLLTFAGHAYGASGADEVAAIAAAEAAAVRDTAAVLRERGIEARTLSVGTTPTCHRLELQRGATHVRPGNYVFHDATQVALGVVDESRCAFSVLATVIGRHDERRLILDAGSKALAAEVMSSLTTGYGLVAGHPELRVERLYEEHAIVTGTEPIQIPIGARVRVIPNHACTAVNLHDELVVVQRGAVVDRWSVDARGHSR